MEHNEMQGDASMKSGDFYGAYLSYQVALDYATDEFDAERLRKKSKKAKAAC